MRGKQAGNAHVPKSQIGAKSMNQYYILALPNLLKVQRDVTGA
jgi:hypothetical protein